MQLNPAKFSKIQQNRWISDKIDENLRKSMKILENGITRRSKSARRRSWVWAKQLVFKKCNRFLTNGSINTDLQTKQSINTDLQTKPIEHSKTPTLRKRFSEPLKCLKITKFMVFPCFSVYLRGVFNVGFRVGVLSGFIGKSVFKPWANQ